MEDALIERIKEYLETLTDEEKVGGFRFGSSCTGHINILRIAVDQPVETPYNCFRTSFYQNDTWWQQMAKCRDLHRPKILKEFEIPNNICQGWTDIILLITGDDDWLTRARGLF